jgi:hypothetical protein
MPVHIGIQVIEYLQHIFSNVIYTALVVIVASPQFVEPSSHSCRQCNFFRPQEDIIDLLGWTNMSHSCSTLNRSQGRLAIPEFLLLSLIGSRLQAPMLIVRQLCVLTLLMLGLQRDFDATLLPPTTLQSHG